MSKHHELKTWPEYFDLTWRGLKNFEIRKDDRGFAVGDTLTLIEQPLDGEPTGRIIEAVVHCKISGDTKLPTPLPLGHCVLGIGVVLRYDEARRG